MVSSLSRTLSALLLSAGLLGCRGGQLVSGDAPPPVPSGVAEQNASLKPRVAPLAVGDGTPPFLLLDQKGVPVTAGELSTGKGAVLVFIPGAEAPAARPAFEWARRHQTLLRQQGIEVLFVSPDPIPENASAAAAESLRLAFLSDPKGWVSRSYGVIPEKQTAAVNSWIFLLGSDGRIQYVDSSFAEPYQLILAAQTLPGSQRQSPSIF